MSATQSNIYNGSGTLSSSSTFTFSGSTQSNILTIRNSGGLGIGTTSSTLSVSNSSSLNWSASISMTTYHILGEDFEMDTMYQDMHLTNVIATLNVLGEPYWRELKKNNVNFDDDLDKFIEDRLKKIKRENNIDKIVGTNTKT